MSGNTPPLLTLLQENIRSLHFETPLGDCSSRKFFFFEALSHLAEEDGHVRYILELQPEWNDCAPDIQSFLQTSLMKIKGVASVQGALTQQKKPATSKPSSPHGIQPQIAPEILQKLGKVIVVSSAKGGVGKSTTALNFAVSLAQQGLQVGLLDADIYGPSIPTLTGILDRPEVSLQKKIIPHQKFGLHLMSLGFLIPEEQAMVWRGPMVQGAFLQLIRDTEWPDLDVFVIDLPPGTGDIQLTLAQQLPIDGAVIVTTPQDLALIDARRGVYMFQKMNIPVVGIVENMSSYTCPRCGHQDPLFGEHGGAKEAKKLNIPLLGQIPLTLSIRLQSDEGVPVALGNTPEALCYQTIAKKVWQSLQVTEEK